MSVTRFYIAHWYWFWLTADTDRLFQVNKLGRFYATYSQILLLKLTNNANVTMKKDNDPINCYSTSLNRSNVDRFTESLWYNCCLLTEKHRVVVRMFCVCLCEVNATAWLENSGCVHSTHATTLKLVSVLVHYYGFMSYIECSDSRKYLVKRNRSEKIRKAVSADRQGR